MNSSYNEEIRDKCAKMLNKQLDNEKLARLIEKDIYNSVIKDSKKEILKGLGIVLVLNLYTYPE